mmetsp:Transcript_14202/g.23328  ORF Transcript_14202/g.23328 Transcript_14202/m.23328 type:complete len:86 (-) Transcript_14202:1259-1516(-)
MDVQPMRAMEFVTCSSSLADTCSLYHVRLQTQCSKHCNLAFDEKDKVSLILKRFVSPWISDGIAKIPRTPELSGLHNTEGLGKDT